ncbi:hypothetical protein Tco_1312730 [Tanacetum coccineum]
MADFINALRAAAMFVPGRCSDNKMWEGRGEGSLGIERKQGTLIKKAYHITVTDIAQKDKNKVKQTKPSTRLERA